MNTEEDGWMDLMDRCMDGLVGGWVDLMDGWINGWMDGLVD